MPAPSHAAVRGNYGHYGHVGASVFAGLARELGYATHSYISDIEAGRTIPRVEFTIKIADFFMLAWIS